MFLSSPHLFSPPPFSMTRCPYKIRRGKFVRVPSSFRQDAAEPIGRIFPSGEFRKFAKDGIIANSGHFSESLLTFKILQSNSSGSSQYCHLCRSSELKHYKIAKTKMLFSQPAHGKHEVRQPWKGYEYLRNSILVF